MIVKLSLLLMVLLFSSGCYFTYSTLNLGVVHADLEWCEKTWPTSDNKVVVLAKVCYNYKAGNLLRSGRYNSDYKWRHIIADENLVEILFEKYYRIRVEPDILPSNKLPKVRHLSLYPSQASSVPLGSWVIVPNSQKLPDVDDAITTNTMIYRNSHYTQSSKIIVNGEVCSISFKNDGYEYYGWFIPFAPPSPTLQKKKLWWHYPSLILVPPAIVLDVVTTPLILLAMAVD